MRAKLSVSPGGSREAGSQYAALSIKDRLCCRGLPIFVGKRGPSRAARRGGGHNLVVTEQIASNWVIIPNFTSISHQKG